MPRRKSTHVDNPHEVGRRLREARERAGLSQRQLSFPGCSPAYISRIEAGDRIPSLQLLREMGRRLGVSEDYLATGTERHARSRPGRGRDQPPPRRAREAARLYGEALGQATTSDEQARALAGLGQLAYREGKARVRRSPDSRRPAPWGASSSPTHPSWARHARPRLRVGRPARRRDQPLPRARSSRPRSRTTVPR